MTPHFFSKTAILALIIALCLGSFPAPVRAGSLADTSPLKAHTIKFYLDPALVPDLGFAKAALSLYVSDMNTILAKNTNRQLVFDPETGIILTSTKPQTDSARPPLPAEGFEIWANALWTDRQTSYGGYAGMDISGAGVLAGLNWTRIYNPDQLTAGDVQDYSFQLNIMLHELAHVFGAGIGEYYSLSYIADTTMSDPLLNINLNTPGDQYWENKPDFMTDPLLRMTYSAPRAEYLNHVRYSNLTAAVISGNYRNGIPSFEHFTVQVLDENEQPVADANVKVWNVQGTAPNASELLSDNLTDENGKIVFAWGGVGSPHNSRNFLRLIKVYKDGAPFEDPKYISIFDADAALLVSQDTAYTVTFKAVAAPQAATFLSAANFDGFVLEKSETADTGGTFNANAAILKLGDDAKNRQYKNILSFDTSNLPNEAIITSAVLKIKQSGAPTGKNPFSALGNLLVDIQTGAFGGAQALALNDFKAPAAAIKAGVFDKSPDDGWYSVNLNPDGVNNLSKASITQFRLYFAKDDNNNLRADSMNFVSGNSASDKPQLVIVYSLP
jgi:hypothetical protein